MTKAQNLNKAETNPQNLPTQLRDVRESDIDEILKYREFRKGEIDIVRVKLTNAINAFRKLNRAIEEESVYFKKLNLVKNSIRNLSRKVADLQAINHRRINNLNAVLEVDRNFNPREISEWSIKEFWRGISKLSNSIQAAFDSKPLRSGPDNRGIVWFVAQLNDIVQQHSDGGSTGQSIKNRKNIGNDRSFTIAALQIAEPNQYYLSDSESGKIHSENSRVLAIRKDKSANTKLKKLLSEIRSSLLIKYKDHPKSTESAMSFFEKELDKKLRTRF